MKLLYILATASVISLSSWGQSPVKSKGPIHLRSSVETMVLSGHAPVSKAYRTKYHAASNSPSRDYILGDYDIDYRDQYNDRDIFTQATISAGENDNAVIVSIPVDLGSLGRPVVDFPATYENGVLTFTSGVELKMEVNGNTFTDPFFIYHWRDDESDYDFVETATAEWVGYGFAFDDDDIFCMADPKDQYGAWFAIGQFFMEKDLTQNPDFDINEGWRSVGNAHLQDGWVLPGFQMDQFAEENIWEVELQQNESDPNIYRLVNPYKGNCPIAHLNESNRPGFIQFDLSYPDYVTFFPVDAGFAYADLGIQKFYCQNFMTYMVGFFGDAPEDVIDEFDSPTMQWGNFKDGVLHLPYFLDGEYGYANDATFGMQGKVFSSGNWVKENPDFLFGEPVNMDTKIYFPNVGVAGIWESDEETYYNLQGIKLSSPRHGELVICKKNGKISKMIFR